MRFVYALSTVIFVGLSLLEILAPGYSIFRIVNIVAVLSFACLVRTSHTEQRAPQRDQDPDPDPDPEKQNHEIQMNDLYTCK